LWSCPSTFFYPVGRRFQQVCTSSRLPFFLRLPPHLSFVSYAAGGTSTLASVFAPYLTLFFSFLPPSFLMSTKVRTSLLSFFTRDASFFSFALFYASPRRAPSYKLPCQARSIFVPSFFVPLCKLLASFSLCRDVLLVTHSLPPHYTTLLT